MKHKLYLNIQNFLTDFIFTTTLHGKYALVEQQIDLNFHRRFSSFDEYLLWATRQIFSNLESYARLLEASTDIQKLYQLMDSARTNPEILFDIEQTLRTVLPFSLYIDNKDTIYEAYFELIECFLEDLLLFQSLNPNPTIPETNLPETSRVDETFEDGDEGRIEKELVERLSSTTPSLMIDPQSHSDSESETETPPKSDSEPEPETETTSKSDSEPESETETIHKSVSEPEQETEQDAGPEPETESGTYFKNRMNRFPPLEPKPKPKPTLKSEQKLYFYSTHEKEKLEAAFRNWVKEKYLFANALQINLGPILNGYFQEAYVGTPNKEFFTNESDFFVRVKGNQKEFNDQLQKYLNGNKPRWTCDRKESETNLEFEHRWRKELYKYALNLRDNNVTIHLDTLHSLNVSIFQFAYIAQLIMKHILCAHDNWKKSHTSVSMALSVFRSLTGGKPVQIGQQRLNSLYTLLVNSLNLNEKENE